MDGPALGVVWDGTGFGTDGTIWGGEFLLGDATGYERVAHLRPFTLPGGDAAVHEPAESRWPCCSRSTAKPPLLSIVPPVRHFREPSERLLAQMLDRRINSPATTSMGRLFDGIASLAGLPQTVTFEGQAAIRLEHIADVSERGAYAFGLRNKSHTERPGRQPRPVSCSTGSRVVQAVIEDVRACRAVPSSRPASTTGLSVLSWMLRALVAGQSSASC